MRRLVSCEVVCFMYVKGEMCNSERGGEGTRVGDARCCRQQLFLLRCCSNCSCRAMLCVVCTWQVERVIGRGEGTRGRVML